MTKEEFTLEYKLKIYAHRWWNFNEIPPRKYWNEIWDYIRKHPEEFNGAGPQ